MPEPLSPAEDASLYVLDLLAPESRRAFEAELEASAELRRHVAELESTLEALALASPPVHPPPRVWTAIAGRTASAPSPVSPGPATLWGWVRAWLANGWAMAAVLAGAFLIHLGFESSGPGPDRSVAASSGTADQAGAAGQRGSGHAAPAGGGAAGGQASDSHEPANPVARATSGGRSLKLAQDESRLQDRVRLLSEQVTLLTRLLAQQSVLPAGAARLQVFRLVSTNSAFDATEAQLLEARRLAGVGTTGTGGGNGVRQETQGEGGGAATASGTGTGAGVSPGTGAGSGTGSGTALAAVSDAGAGGTGGQSGLEDSTPDVSLTLALAAARQMAAVTIPKTAPADSGEGTVASRAALGSDPAGSGFAALVPPPVDAGLATAVIPVEAVSEREAIRLIDLNQILASQSGAGLTLPGADTGLVSDSEGSAFGAYSPDTGQGAVAFRVPADASEAGVLQLWLTDAQTGIVQSLGFTPVGGGVTAPEVMVLRFTVDAQSVTTPTFMITREPVGGSAAPTGPVIAVPPSGSP